MARHAIREPRYTPPAPPTIGVQHDLFGAAPIVHEPRRKPLKAGWGRDLLKYHLADWISDVEARGSR